MEREVKLNEIGFVWNTVIAMWEERFCRLKEWKKGNGHCSVPIAQGELGTWVSKQRQLRKRGKLSAEKLTALNGLDFTWSRADADWEEKFKRLCEWTNARGHASVPFNEGELGWWVNTQRQCKRKGKLSASREARLQSLRFVWNPSISRSRAILEDATFSSAETTPTTSPVKYEQELMSPCCGCDSGVPASRRIHPAICGSHGSEPAKVNGENAGTHQMSGIVASVGEYILRQNSHLGCQENDVASDIPMEPSLWSPAILLNGIDSDGLHCGEDIRSWQSPEGYSRAIKEEPELVTDITSVVGGSVMLADMGPAIAAGSVGLEELFMHDERGVLHGEEALDSFCCVEKM